MKKFLCLAILFFAFSTGAMAAAGITQISSDRGEKAGMLWAGYTITANASATFADYTLTTVGTSTEAADFTGTIVKVETSAGSTAPTAGFDVTLFDSNSVNVSGSLLKNRTLAMQSTPCNMIVKGPLTIRIEGNSVNNAVVYFRIFYTKSVISLDAPTVDEYVELTTDGQAFTGPGFVTGVLVGKSSPSSVTQVVVKLYDNTSATGSKVGPDVFIEGSAAAAFPAGWLDSVGWPVTNGCYVDVNNADLPGAEIFIKYRRN